MTDDTTAPRPTHVPTSVTRPKRGRPARPKHPLAGQVQEANRRARRRGLAEKIELVQREAVYKHFCGRCLKCGRRECITIDHVVPLSRGGRNVIENVQPLCKWCNSVKRAQTIDYRADPPGLRLAGGMDDEQWYKDNCSKR